MYAYKCCFEVRALLDLVLLWASEQNIGRGECILYTPSTVMTTTAPPAVQKTSFGKSNFQICNAFIGFKQQPL